MANDIEPAIAKLEAKLVLLDQQARGIRMAIDVLRETEGLPSQYSDGTTAPSSAAHHEPAQVGIGRDAFFGKKQSTAIRAYLEMRKRTGFGPATPREIFDSLKAGGYQYEAKSDDIALVGLRALLRKNTTTFTRVPGTGAYGLASWYPDARRPKLAGDHAASKDQTGAEQIGADDAEAATTADEEVVAA